MDWLHIILLLAGGVLAISGLIVAKKPDAKALIDKLVPFQAAIGVALLVIGVLRLFQLGPITVFKVMSLAPVLGITMIGATYGAILLGFMFGMPQIAKWIPGESNAEVKASELAKKLAPAQVIIGLVVLASGVLLMLLTLRIINPF